MTVSGSSRMNRSVVAMLLCGYVNPGIEASASWRNPCWRASSVFGASMRAPSTAPLSKALSRSRCLRGGPASAADYLHVSREQHLKRLASTLEKDEINIQTIALERAGFFGDIQHVDAGR